MPIFRSGTSLSRINPAAATAEVLSQVGVCPLTDALKGAFMMKGGAKIQVADNAMTLPPSTRQPVELEAQNRT